MRKRALAPLTLTLTLTLAASALSAQTAPEPSQAPKPVFGLVFELGDQTRVLALPGGVLREVAPSLAGGVPALRLQVGALEYRTQRTEPVRSPDGKRIVHVLSAAERAALHGEIAVTDSEGGNAQLLTSNGQHNDYPVWFPDSRRLLYQRQRVVEGKVEREAVVHDLESDRVEPFVDQAVVLRARPLFLADGRLLYVRVRQTDDGPKRSLMLTGPGAGGEPTLVADEAAPIEGLAHATSGRVFVCARDRVALLDVERGEVIDAWPLAELAKPGWRVELAAMFVRPDGGAVAVTFRHTGARRSGAHPAGEDHVVVIEPGRAAEHGVSHHQLGAGMRLRRWCTADELERARLKD